MPINKIIEPERFAFSFHGARIVLELFGYVREVDTFSNKAEIKRWDTNRGHYLSTFLI